MSLPPLPAPLSHRLKLRLLLFAVALGALAAFVILRAYPDPGQWLAGIQVLFQVLQDHPWALLLALATLPGIGFPISPLLILVGITIAPRYGMLIACLLGVAAQSICITWTYLLAAGPLREVIAAFIRRRRELPNLTEANMWRLGLILRITPGIPYAFQNLALGVLGMRLKPYLLISLPITSGWAIGFIVTGGALFEGRAGLAIAGGLVLIALILATRIYTQRKAVHV